MKSARGRSQETRGDKGVGGNSPWGVEHDERGVRFGDAGREVGVGEVEDIVFAGGDERDERG